MITLITILTGVGLAVFLRNGWEPVFYAIRKRIRNQQQVQPGEYGPHWPDWNDRHHWLTTHNNYYKGLNNENQLLFQHRLIEFMKYKEFSYINLEAHPAIPLLISAAAIQLSFGLTDFRFDFFDRIIVTGGEYKVNWHKQAFQGHVNQDGIHLCWDHFLHGYQHYGDGHNLGLHEMAHALTYGALLGKTRMEPEFTRQFKEYVKVATPVLRKMRNGETSFLNPYAATNFHEFWAVSIETFFEQSGQFKANEPELYLSLCQLLNQDPLELMLEKAA